METSESEGENEQTREGERKRVNVKEEKTKLIQKTCANARLSIECEKSRFPFVGYSAAAAKAALIVKARRKILKRISITILDGEKPLNCQMSNCKRMRQLM